MKNLNKIYFTTIIAALMSTGSALATDNGNDNSYQINQLQEFDISTATEINTRFTVRFKIKNPKQFKQLGIDSLDICNYAYQCERLSERTDGFVIDNGDIVFGSAVS